MLIGNNSNENSSSRVTIISSKSYSLFDDFFRNNELKNNSEIIETSEVCHIYFIFVRP